MPDPSRVSASARPDTVIPGEEEFLKTGKLPDSLATPPAAATPTETAPTPPEPAPAEDQPTETTPDVPAEPAKGETDAPTSDWQAMLDRIDPAELRKHRRLSGIIGQEAQRLARDQVARASEEAARKAADAERQRLRDEEPLRYVELEKQQEIEHQQRLALLAEVDAPLRTLYGDLPDEAQRKLDGKTYPGSAQESRLAYLRDVVQGHVDARVGDVQRTLLREIAKETPGDPAIAKLRGDLIRQLMPAARRAALAEVNGGRPAPDVTGSTVAPRGRLSLQDLEQMSAAEFAKREKELTDEVLRYLPGR